jgi:hypothetical protein
LDDRRLRDRSATATVGCVSNHWTFVVAVFALVFGLYVVFGQGVPRLRDDHLGLGIAVVACGALGAALGLVALLVMLRSKRRQ